MRPEPGIRPRYAGSLRTRAQYRRELMWLAAYVALAGIGGTLFVMGVFQGLGG